MKAPHVISIANRASAVEPSDKLDTGLYLIAANSSNANIEQGKIHDLEAKLRQANHEIARLNASLLHKDQLLQNFRVREYELKANLYSQANA